MSENNIAKNAKILVVDDDPLNIRNAVRILKEDYKVSYAVAGEAALEQISKDIPDLILLDLHMPGMNGFEVLHILKQKEETSDIPVIFLTADSDQETEVRGLKEGALDFIAKPFMDEIVKQRVKHLLELSILQKDLKSEVERQTAKAEERRKQMEEMSFQTVQALAGAIDAKDAYTKGHSSRVSDYSVLLAKKAGWEKSQIDDLRYAALLHDVGKIGVPDAILNKRGKLSDVEFGVIKSHTTIGSDILRNISNVEAAVEVARHHHERYDGKGYPDMLCEEKIPLMARVVCIADSYDAMNSKRIYRSSLPKDVIRNELVKGRGKQFDPYFLDLFLEMFDRGELLKEENNEDALDENANILKRAFESAFVSGNSNQKDALTGLDLRGQAEERISEKMMTGPGALILMDLDNLKKLNDLFGHKAGDELIKNLGEIIASVDEKAISARLGGDEFLIFIEGDSRDKIDAILTNMYSAFEKVKNDNSQFIYNSISCGICLSKANDDFQEVYGNADKALYFAKRNGKGNYHFFKREDDNVSKLDNVDFNTLVKSFEINGSYNGAMQVEYREFSQLFEYVKNMRKRYSHNLQLVMITLESSKDKLTDAEIISASIVAMDEAISSTIRTVDIYTRYSSMQFLLILVGSDSTEISNIMDRVFSNFYKTFDDKRIQPSYQVAEI